MDLNEKLAARRRELAIEAEKRQKEENEKLAAKKLPNAVIPKNVQPSWLKQMLDGKPDVPKSKSQETIQPTAPKPKWQETIEAAMRGNALAQQDLSDLYIEGKFVPKDLKVAFDWLEKAALSGSSTGQAKLGWTYMDSSNSLELATDYRLAMKWNLRAAKQGHKESCNNLALLYENGWGVPVNPLEAANWRMKAINQNAAEGKSGFRLNDAKFEQGNGSENTAKIKDKYPIGIAELLVLCFGIYKGAKGDILGAIFMVVLVVAVVLIKTSMNGKRDL